MARRAFYSFHFIPDSWRASQLRNMGVIEGNRPASHNDWEAIAGRGGATIRSWIDDQMYEKSVSILLTVWGFYSLLVLMIFVAKIAVLN